jgi:hypothetical protein
LRLKWLRSIVICFNGRAHWFMDLHAWAQIFTSRHNKILRRTSLVQVPWDPLGLPECLAEVVHCAVPLSYDTHRVDPRLLTISPLSANSRICASCAKSSSSMVTNDC